MDSVKTIIQSLLNSAGDLTQPQQKFLITLFSTEQHNSDSNFVFSMASYKRRGLNHHLLERFIDKLDKEAYFN